MDIGNNARFHLLKRELGDECINPYNPHILRVWGAKWLALSMVLLSTSAIRCAKTKLRNLDS